MFLFYVTVNKVILNYTFLHLVYWFNIKKHLIVIARYRVQYEILFQVYSEPLDEGNIYTKNFNEVNIPYCIMFKEITNLSLEWKIYFSPTKKGFLYFSQRKHCRSVLLLTTLENWFKCKTKKQHNYKNLVNFKFVIKTHIIKYTYKKKTRYTKIICKQYRL